MEQANIYVVVKKIKSNIKKNVKQFNVAAAKMLLSLMAARGSV